MDPMGRDQRFDPTLHAEFQRSLAEFGVPDIVAGKEHVLNGIAAGLSPESYTLPSDRFSSSAARLAMRQQARIGTFGRYRSLSWSVSPLGGAFMILPPMRRRTTMHPAIRPRCLYCGQSRYYSAASAKGAGT
jgi:hypothetical protein